MTALRNLAVILGSALVAAVVAGPSLQPMAVRAEDETEAKPARSLVIDGVKLSLELEKEKYAAGEKPVLTLCAANTTDAERSVSVEVVAEGNGPLDSDFDVEIARIAFIAKPLWIRLVPLALRAGETKKIRVDTEGPLVAGSAVSYILRTRERQPRVVISASVQIPRQEKTRAK